MSLNQQPSQPSLEAAAEYASCSRLLHNGLLRAGQRGFDFGQAMQADRGNEDPSDSFSIDRVMHAAVELAHAAELDDRFFDRPANVVLLLGAAGSWVQTERRIQMSPSYNPALVDERTSLADIILMLADHQSGVVRSMKASGSTQAEKFCNVENGPHANDESALDTFLEGLCDTDLASQVQSVLAEDGPRSFLAHQRLAFGLTPATERPFRVRVLRIAADILDLADAGFYVYEDRRTNANGTPIKPSATLREKEALAASYVQAHQAYIQRFEDTFGPLSRAWTNTYTHGTSEIILTAPLAYALLNNSQGKAYKSRATNVNLGTVRHEWAHTQRQINTGGRLQLGLLVEERKADLAAGDTNSYPDGQYLFQDLSLATGTDLTGELAKAVRAEDALSSFVCNIASKIGLRNTLLLIAAKPAAYDQYPVEAMRFADLRWLRADGDASTLDALLREVIARRGAEMFTRNVGAFVMQHALDGKDSYSIDEALQTRRDSGITRSIPAYEQALQEVYTLCW